jgi:hypothetical protein
VPHGFEGSRAHFDVRIPPDLFGWGTYGRVMDTDAMMFTIVPIPSDVIDLERSKLGSTSEALIVSVIAKGGEPARCCLTNALPGELLILFNYEPPLPSSPYREKGAVFAHAVQCRPTLDPHAYPTDWRGKPQVLRAYDERGWIHAAIVHDGSSPEGSISSVFEDRAVVEIHSRNVAYGCYMFSLRRAED